MSGEQLPLDLGYRTSLGRENFLISSSNKEAVAWVDKWPDWPAFAMVIYGAKSCGKTHILHVWAERSAALVMDANDLTLSNIEDISNEHNAIAIDNIENIFGHAEQEEALFHLYNIFKETGKNLLLSSGLLPGQWEVSLKDLSSRLKSLMAVGIQEPDDTLLASVLLKLFSDRQLNVQEGVVSYLIPRIKRSMVFVTDVVERADKRALVEKRPVSIPLVREILKEIM